MENFINKIICGDCISVMGEMPDNSVDLIVTSPPYNCNISYDVYNDNLKWEDYLRWCRKWLGELHRLLKSDGRICINVLLEMGIENNKRRVSPYAEFYRLFGEVGLNNFGSPVWTDNHRVKYTAWGSWLSASAPYIYNPFEVIMLGYKNQRKKINKGKSTINKEEFMNGCGGVWNLRTQTKELTKTNFHTDLPDMCIKLLSYENDIVLDPFMGSGTTCLSAKKLNRKWIGIELSPNYCRVAERRLSQECFKF